VPDLTEPNPVDVALKVLLDTPSYAAQLLITTARLLEMDPTQPLTGLARERAIDIASDAILRTLPDVVARDSMQRMYRALPDTPAPITRGEYALRLRQAATNMDTLGGTRMDFTCCGRPMRREGSQLVCGKCGAYTDPGTHGGSTLRQQPADPDHGAGPTELLARCADDYATAAARRHAGDEPSVSPELTALAIEAAEAAPDPGTDPA
jgi:hypothetical protein